MGGLGDYKPEMVMFGIQFSYAIMSLTVRAAMLEGMSPRVFIVYRQAIATLVMTPISFFSRRKSSGCSIGWKSFGWMFLASLIGITINQNVYFEGIYLASSSTASAMGNLVPAITFVIASIIGLETINTRSLRSIAKILGTLLCVSGAITVALLRGSKLLNSEFPWENSLFGSGGDQHWLLGCLFLFAYSCCWSLWLILQVPTSASYPDHLSQSAWMCFMATLQSAVVTFFLEKDPNAWILSSNLQLFCCLFSGTIGSGLTFFLQGWCISQRGPLFSAMFNPLCTVIVHILAAIFLHEEIYTGSLVGAVGVIIGLYVVLWGKAKDLEKMEEEMDPKLQSDQTETVKILIDGFSDETGCKTDLEQPLLCEKSIDNNEG